MMQRPDKVSLATWIAVVILPALLCKPSHLIAESTPAAKPKSIATLTTVYYHNSHADVIASRLFQTNSLDDQGRRPALSLTSLYVEQFPERREDRSRGYAARYGFEIVEPEPTAVMGQLNVPGRAVGIRRALMLDQNKLAVDGVLLIAEHGEYPESATGSIRYPKREMFQTVVEVFEEAGRAVPVFFDKHLSDNWEDAKWIYDQSKRLNFPMMAGSSLPVTWRRPAASVQDDEPLEEIVVVSFHRLDTYGFHALEIVQCLAEARKGGETGIKQVQTLTGDAVWQAGEQGVYDEALLQQALSRVAIRRRAKGKPLSESVKEPALFVIDYEDGLRANVLTLNGAVVEWAAAWQYESGESASTLFWTQEARPFSHFGLLLDGVEKMMHTGKPTWPVERTLLSSGALDALLQSKLQGGKVMQTPQLDVDYQSDWRWSQPGEPVEPRPIHGQ